MKEYLKDPIKVPLERLLLDPNNPRFAEDFSFAKKRVPENAIRDHQFKIIEHFKIAENDQFGGLGYDRADHEDKIDELIEDTADTNYGLTPLVDSIASIGFVPIDKPVVTKIKGTDDYLVIEGNRRVCSCKLLLKKHEKNVSEGKRGSSNQGESIYVLDEARLNSIKELDVVELDLDGADEEEIDKRVRVILGVRHHGSLLPWEPLPSAYNIYRKYMSLEPELDEFVWENKRVKKVLRIFALGDKSPRKALASYVAYQQLQEAGFKVKPKWFSLIQELVTNAKLKSRYLEVNDSTFRLSEDSLSKVDLLCQFENRDELSHDAKENFKILRDPKSVKSFAKVVDAQGHPDESVQNFAKSLLIKIESSDPDEQIPLEAMKNHPRQSAIDALNEFLHSLKWVDQLEKLIFQLNAKTEKGDAELKFDDFGGSDELWLEKLDKQMTVFRRMYDIS